MSQSELYSSLGSGLPEYEYRKQLTPLTVYIQKYIIYRREERFLSIPIFSELSRFSEWNSAKRFFDMSAVPLVRRCKYKNYLAKNVHREPYFLQKHFIFLGFTHLKLLFSSFLLVTCPSNTYLITQCIHCLVHSLDEILNIYFL